MVLITPASTRLRWREFSHLRSREQDRRVSRYYDTRDLVVGISQPMPEAETAFSG